MPVGQDDLWQGLVHVLGVIVAVAPLVWAPWAAVAAQYYGTLILMAAALHVVRNALLDWQPENPLFQRPRRQPGRSQRGGFPSGHMAAVAFAGAVGVRLVERDAPACLAAAWGAAVGATVLMALARWHLGYHTVPQLVAGAVTGITVA